MKTIVKLAKRPSVVTLAAKAGIDLPSNGYWQAYSLQQETLIDNFLDLLERNGFLKVVVRNHTPPLYDYVGVHQTIRYSPGRAKRYAALLGFQRQEPSMKTVISVSNSPVTLAAGRITLAKKILEPLGLSTGSVTDHLMTGGIAYILSQDQFSGSGPAIVKQLRDAIRKNRLVLDKALSELSEDINPPIA